MKAAECCGGVFTSRKRGTIYWAFILLALSPEIESKPLGDELTPFELSEYLNGTFLAQTWNGSWIADDTILYRAYQGDILLYNVTLRKPQLFISQSSLASFPGAAVSLSPDNRFILIQYNVSSVFRHSTTALYTVYDISNNAFYQLAGGQPIQLAQWCPNGHGIIYVFLNNILYLPDISSTLIPISLTNDGVSGIIYNGVPDWVYEEEVLGTGKAFWVSGDGRYLTYARFDDTLVREYSYPVYGIPGSLEDQYPTIVTIRYPKVGTPNPDVRLYLIDLSTPTTSIELTLIHPLFAQDNFIFYGVTWITNEEFAVLSTNRVQNRAELVRCHVSGVCVDEAYYESPNGWLEFGTIKYNKLGNLRVEILPQTEGNDTFDHLVLTDVETRSSTRLTKGRFHVKDLYGFDDENGILYYSASVEGFPSQQHVYSIDTKTLESKCLTCNIKSGSALCTYASASFSKDLTYITKSCSGPGPDFIQIESTIAEDDSAPIVWEDNADLVKRLAGKLQPVVKDLRVPLPGGLQAEVRLLLPPDLDETQKYPAIVNVYAGPNSNQISDSFKVGFQHYLVTNRKYIYIFIDGRGSGLDGKNKQFQIYRKLGTVEIEDQINVTRYLQDNYSFIDRNRTAIWGWSYGGFATTWSLIKDQDNVFKCGIAVAPVTDFIYYDSIYTERYMGLPSPVDNLSGYNNTDITRRVEGLRGKSYFLIHGSGDDNVHYQQSLLLSKALEYADIPFRQQTYTDEQHSLTHVSPHLYHTMDRFWESCLGENQTAKKLSR